MTMSLIGPSDYTIGSAELQRRDKGNANSNAFLQGSEKLPVTRKSIKNGESWQCLSSLIDKRLLHPRCVTPRTFGCECGLRRSSLEVASLTWTSQLPALRIIIPSTSQESTRLLQR